MGRCAAIKPNGERCKADAMPDAEWCWSHHPDYEQARQRRASKGGKRGGRGRPSAATGELVDIKKEIRAVIAGVLTGRVERSTGGTLFMGFNTLLRAVEVQRKVTEQDEVLARLEEVERRVQANNQQQRGTRAW